MAGIEPASKRNIITKSTSVSQSVLSMKGKRLSKNLSTPILFIFGVCPRTDKRDTYPDIITPGFISSGVGKSGWRYAYANAGSLDKLALIQVS